MVIIGHPLIPNSQQWYRIYSQDDIKKTASNSVVFFDTIEENNQIAIYANQNGVTFGVLVASLYDALLAASLGASYIVSKNKELTQEIQAVANEYLWNTKVLQLIQKNSEVEAVAKSSIDGVIFESFIR